MPLLFVSREPVTRERNGSTAAVRNLLTLFRDHGTPIAVLITTGGSRSPRLFFRSAFPLPAGCALHVPGYFRLGRWFIRPLHALPWLRLASRLLQRSRRLSRLQNAIERLGGSRLFTNSWDLTEPTTAERRILLRAIHRLQPETVLANYAFWGPALRDLPSPAPHRAILLHDLLAEHVRLFQQAGLPLDCNPITTDQETRWLHGADTLIAVQREEAESVRSRMRGEVDGQDRIEVHVQPISLPCRAAFIDPEPRHCLFVGSDSTPNLQGLQWLLGQVWPLVLAVEPHSTLAVAGTVRNRWKGSLPRGVNLLGPVRSLAAEHDRAAACLVPLLVGSGIKIKLLEALSHGKATVSTPVGVQGLEDWAAGAVAVAQNPEDFAAAILHLLQNPILRRGREASATRLARQHFGPGNPGRAALLHRLCPQKTCQPPSHLTHPE